MAEPSYEDLKARVAALEKQVEEIMTEMRSLFSSFHYILGEPLYG